MKRTAWFAGVLLLALPLATAWAGPLLGKRQLERLNLRLHGSVVDYTHNHGADNRIWSNALKEKRDLYIYLPPGFDPQVRYPFMLWLHGFAQDEQSFLKYVVEPLDRAIACGKLPPLIIAAPDGSVEGNGSLFSAGSFYLNTDAGDFEDYIMQDVWDFVLRNYPIRPERKAHIIAGVSMGGGAAYNLAIKYRCRFKIVLGIFPPLNTRWIDCHGRYMGNFDPNCWGWRTSVDRGQEVVGRFGPIKVRLRKLLYPLYDDRGPQTVEEMSRQNPIEMLDAYDVRPGELSMYVGYGPKDQFNIDAQVESFLYRARERGLCVAVGYEPRGKHDVRTALRLLPGLLDWLGPQVWPYAPGVQP